MRTITIEIDEQGYTVREGERYADGLCWDEMLGQISELTHPRLGQARYAMQTAAEWAEYRKRFEPRRERAPDDEPVLQLTHQKNQLLTHQQDQEM
jgi:hypothetical protein